MEERPRQGKLRAGPLWHPTSARTAGWPGTASSAGRAPATGSTGSGWEGGYRWASVRARWRYGLAMSASRYIPGPSIRGSDSSCQASGRVCRQETTVPGGRRWRYRSPWARWSVAPWTPTNWPPWEAHDDRPGAGQAAPGEPGPQAGRGGAGQYPGRGRQQATHLSREAGATAGRRGGGPRRERYLSTRIKMAHFPFQRTLEQLDFSFQPSVDERQIKELANLAFVAEATNILMLGPPGVGKTHLAVALAKNAIERGYGAYFVRAYELMEDRRGPGPSTTWTGGCGSAWRPRCWWWTSSAFGPTTGRPPPPSSRWCQPGTNGAAPSSRPTRASASGANSSATR